MKQNKPVYYLESKCKFLFNLKHHIEYFSRGTNGNHPNDAVFRNTSKQSSSAALSDTSPSPPQQEANIDDEERHKREIAKRREEDRKRREVNTLIFSFI